MSTKIAIIDYGMGNLRSVAKAIEYVSNNANILITNKPKIVANADYIIFPGQGAAAESMKSLHHHELEAVVNEAAKKKPFLGICMGMQVLMSHSAENGGINCLDLFDGDVLPFSKRILNPNLKIPHMGWNEILQKPHPLWTGIKNGSRFYFVHSYYVQPKDETITLGICDYGIPFTAAIGRENVFAIQGHPEKSAEAGLQLLKNFVEWDGQA